MLLFKDFCLLDKSKSTLTDGYQPVAHYLVTVVTDADYDTAKYDRTVLKYKYHSTQLLYDHYCTVLTLLSLFDYPYFIIITPLLLHYTYLFVH